MVINYGFLRGDKPNSKKRKTSFLCLIDSVMRNPWGDPPSLCRLLKALFDHCVPKKDVTDKVQGRPASIPLNRLLAGKLDRKSVDSHRRFPAVLRLR